MNKPIITIVAIAVVIGGGAFYGGMQYAESKSPRRQFSRADFQNLFPGERQQRSQELGANVGGFRGGRMGGQTGSGFTAGEIIAKDDKSMTIKLQDGGSKIVFLPESAEIAKWVSGTRSDLEIGKIVTVSGTNNSDGSVTAQSVQIRQAGSLPLGGAKGANQ